MKMIRLAGLALVGALAATMHAQSYKVLSFFSNIPDAPAGLIAQSRGGSLLTMDRIGDVFRMSPSGGYATVLHDFGADSRNPGGLTLGRNGRFYGTTSNGGTNGYGTIYEMTPDGIVKNLHEFIGSDDGYPQAPPIQSLYGDFYGTATGVVDGTPGTLYKINSYGDYTELHLFLGTDGLNPVGPLVQATNYWFYGTASSGGAHGEGTIFRISSGGTFEALHNFDGTDGANPLAGLIQANDGNFYGVTSRGGSYGGGVIFRMTASHQFTVLHNFTGVTYTAGPTAGNDGAGPLWQLVQATDGYLYGTTYGGGSSGWGVLFRISTSGEFTVLHNFSPGPSCMNSLACFDGGTPGALIQHTNGFLYGFTETGGEESEGVFYRFDIGQPPFVTYLPSYGRVGMTVQILGQYFTAESEVFFNGVQAQVTAVEPTYMRAVVPDGATSGFITVTTAKGTLKSDKVFLVRP
jgi:uncharacterized repeat protein (TIGR03803 family)